MTSSNDPEYVAVDVTSKMGVLDEATCVELLESTPIGRIGFSTDGELLVLPVNYRWYEQSVVFRTLEGLKLAAAAHEQHVCFEVDHWDADSRTGWSVVVQGVAREVTNWAEEARLDHDAGSDLEARGADGAEHAHLADAVDDRRHDCQHT